MNSEKNSTKQHEEIKIKDSSIFRPYVESREEIQKLSNEINVSATQLVNLFCNIGAEALKKALPLIKDDIDNSIKKLLK